MANAYAEVVAALRRARAEHEKEIRKIDQTLAEFGYVAATAGSPEGEDSNLDYAGLGPLEAVRRYMQGVGRPVTTRELVDALLARGVRTTSRNFTSSIYATLKNSKEFKRNERGQWELVAPPSSPSRVARRV